MTRNRYLAPLAALSLLATSAPAFAKAQEGDGNGSVTATSKSEKKICKTFENTASRMKREKLCLTRAQWKKFDAEAH
jgi:hypothetical protein